MKRLYLFLVTLLVASMSMTTVSCKKQQITLDTTQGEATLARIMDFKQKVDYYKANPAIKDGEAVTIDEAIWNIEALFNLTYAYPDLSYGRTETADTVLYLPVGSDHTVLLTDLTVFYGQMYEVISEIYHSIELDSKQFIILDVELGERHGNQQAIRLHSIQGSEKGTPPGPDIPQMWQPFAEGISWYYGEDMGNNAGILPDDIDAADTLSRLLNAILIAQAPHGFTYIYTDPITKKLWDEEHVNYANNSYPECGPYCEFYKENPTEADKWMNADQMNFHYYGERHLVRNILPYHGNDLVPSSYRLCNVTIEDKTDRTTNRIYHHTQATYGRRDIVGENMIERSNL